MISVDKDCVKVNGDAHLISAELGACIFTIYEKMPKQARPALKKKLVQSVAIAFAVVDAGLTPLEAIDKFDCDEYALAQVVTPKDCIEAGARATTIMSKKGLLKEADDLEQACKVIATMMAVLFHGVTDEEFDKMIDSLKEGK